ncbi:MAG: twin-arginine translocation signal domain-containing protein [Verrucomicrobia subdivision 3 bacterium]|nr:twin-arginine translocation signal domain-containing protein [Limisphaerales bacterium]
MNGSQRESDLSNINRRQFLQTTAATLALAGLGPAGPSGARCQAADVAVAVPPPSEKSFSFLHTYEATGRYWKGLAKAGLLRSSNGIRLVHSPFGDDPARRFNTVARVGGELHQLIRQRQCSFVIDRVAGGAPYLAYDFDQPLIAEYAALLGRRFLGGQVHETVCNTHNDWERFVKADKRYATEPVRADALRRYFNWESAGRWLEYGTLDDYAGRVHPAPAAWWSEIERNARRQGSRFGSHFSYAEGSHWGRLTWHSFYQWGAAFGLAEVGPWASEQSQFAIASLRGAAKAAGKPWGIFFAAWGPKGCTSFIPEADWSWNCPRRILDASEWPVGPELGCSSALQRRIFFHAYLSGAHTLHEEWGAEGNLTDWDQGTLSSYGRVTRDLLDFQEAHPDLGEPYTPIALVLDARIPPPDVRPWDRLLKALYQPGPADIANAARPANGQAEVACYPPCVVPELFDIVPSTAPEPLWARYQTVIRAEPGATPAAAPFCPEAQLAERLLAAARELSPFRRTSHLILQVNRRRADGAWIIGLYNPWGAVRGDVFGTGSLLDPGCTQRDVLRATFSIKSARELYAWPEASRLERHGDELHATVGPGGVLIAEIQPKQS